MEREWNQVKFALRINFHNKKINNGKNNLNPSTFQVGLVGRLVCPIRSVHHLNRYLLLQSLLSVRLYTIDESKHQLMSKSFS